MAAVVGPHSFVEALSSSRSLTHASFAVAPQGGGSLVAPGGQLGVRCHLPDSSSISVAAYRLLFVGLGSPPGRSDSFGVLSQEEGLLQINVLEMMAVSRAVAAFLPQLSGQCHPDERQRHSCRLFLASRWHSASCPLSHGHRGSVLDRASFGLPDGQVYSGEEKCSGGPCSSHGMVPCSKGI